MAITTCLDWEDRSLNYEKGKLEYTYQTMQREIDFGLSLKDGRNVYCGRESIQPVMKVSDRHVKFYINYPTDDTSVPHEMLHTESNTACWYVVIKLAKWYNRLDANQKRLVQCRLSCDEEVRSEHVKTAFKMVQIR
tara:strand:+ start:804 stop:1211 length:408 start_codon:yes stop_codon:yes gene_type:complete